MRHITLISLLATFSIGCSEPQKNLLPLELGSFAAAPTTMSIRIKNYSPQPGNSFQHLFVSNFSTDFKMGVLKYSSARDGLSDDLKNQLFSSYSFNTTSSESALLGFADLFLLNAGISSTQYAHLYCSQNNMNVSSFDAFNYQDTRLSGVQSQVLGLRDCVKNYMGLNPQKFDFDNDGIPDYLELRFGLNPANGSDAYLTLGADGVLNIDKVKQNIPIDESANSQPNKLHAYKYETFVNPDTSRDYIVSNIPVLNSGRENFIAFYVVEQNIANKTPSLYTAYMVINSRTANSVVDIDYWATSATTFNNVQITGP